MKPKRHVCTCLTPATHWCPKTGGQYCQQHAEHYASVFGEESLKTFPADKAKPAINKSSELNAANDRIKRLEEAIQERDKEWFQVIESILGFHPVSMTEALRIGIERIKKQKQRIKRLEEAGDAMINEGWNEPHLANAWRKAKEAKL